MSEIKVENSCGCVFCDLALETIQDDDGKHFHQFTARGDDGLCRTNFIGCPVKEAKLLIADGPDEECEAGTAHWEAPRSNTQPLKKRGHDE